jgi:rubredoxin/peptidoglycan/LPS O-acetylase OafA/YrhL
MKELVRCKPCGYVMEADKLKDVCPACGMPRKAFEPYRERVALNRLFILSLDLHPIAIHLSQTFVILIPLLIFSMMLFPGFNYDMFAQVLKFSLYIFPLTLIAAISTGILDGLYRFKTLTPPLLRLKIIFSSIIMVLAAAMFFVAKDGNYGIVTILLSLGCLFCAVRLGLLGKHLIDVILPGSYPVKKAKAGAVAAPEKEE